VVAVGLSATLPPVLFSACKQTVRPTGPKVR
jgi:hypothetical protein